MAESDNSPSTSLSLLLAAQRRDPDALDRLTDLYGRFVWNRCRLRGIKEDEAEDITHEVLIRMLNHLAAFSRERPGSFRKWLGTITRNYITDVRRRDNRRFPADGGSNHRQMLEQIPDASCENDDDEADMATAWLVRDALARIKPRFNDRTWQAFWRTAVENWTAPEVAKELGITAGRVRNCKRQVLARLQQELEGAAESAGCSH